MPQHKIIPLAPDIGTLVDADIFPQLSNDNWTRNSEGYAICFNSSQITYMHRLIVNAQPGQVVDHINGNRLDNRRENLRITTTTVNNQNRPLFSNSTSGYRGVSRNRSRWIARIYYHRRQIHLGTYDDKAEAARAYNHGASLIYGEHAALNEVSGQLSRAQQDEIQARINGTYTPPQPKRIPRGKSPYRGVYWERGRWRAKIGYQNQKIHVGYFMDEESAARAYDAKARELLGDKAQLNFPY